MDKFENTDKSVKEDRKEVIVTSRVLFVNVLDKIFLSIIALIFCVLNFTMFSYFYEVGEKIFGEIIIFIIVFFCYLFLNWYYKCLCKTMLCLTSNGVYKFSCFPFCKGERFIPLDKITSVTVYRCLWFFRVLIIHQYGTVPLVFFTWNNQEFKNELDYLITNDNGSIDNDYKSRNMITKGQYGSFGIAWWHCGIDTSNWFSGAYFCL